MGNVQIYSNGFDVETNILELKNIKFLEFNMNIHIELFIQI